jgi:hypothetical protein
VRAARAGLEGSAGVAACASVAGATSARVASNGVPARPSARSGRQRTLVHRAYREAYNEAMKDPNATEAGCVAAGLKAARAVEENKKNDEASDPSIEASDDPGANDKRSSVDPASDKQGQHDENATKSGERRQTMPDNLNLRPMVIDGVSAELPELSAQFVSRALEDRDEQIEALKAQLKQSQSGL